MTALFPCPCCGHSITKQDAAGFRIIGPDGVDQITVDKCAEVLRSKSDEASYHAGALAGKLSGKLKGRKQSARWNSQKNHYDKICFYYSKASDAIRAIGRKA